VADQKPPQVRQAFPSSGVLPDALYVLVNGLTAVDSWRLASQARSLAYSRAPKLSGASARSMDPYWGEGFFGIRWSRPSLWFVETGHGAFTMRSLAGKTIPMWVPDPLGRLAAQNPKAKTRTTVDGRRQILIFRRAARLGQRKLVTRRVAGRTVGASVPASYPGAPGRIALRSAEGRVLSGNVGVRWRNPGGPGMHFIARSISDVAEAAGLGRSPVHPTLRRT
jgi:hypothetical protein